MKLKFDIHYICIIHSVGIGGFSMGIKWPWCEGDRSSAIYFQSYAFMTCKGRIYVCCQIRRYIERIFITDTLLNQRLSNKCYILYRDENFSESEPGTPFFDHKRNEEILEEMKIEPVGEKLRRNKLNWLRHVKKK